MVSGKKQPVKKHKNWIAGAIKKPGALHRELGVKQGEKIPTKKLAAAAKKGGKEGKRARLAETLKSFHKGKKHKEHSSAAISGLKKFVAEEAKEKGKKVMKKARKHKSIPQMYQSATKGLQNFGRAWAANTAGKQALVNAGKYRLD